MSAREDRRGGLAAQLVERDQRMVAAAEPRGALVDEAAHERSVLVQSRPVLLTLLVEREWQPASALVELTQQERERAEDEAPQDELEVWRAHGHTSRYAAGS